MGQVDPPLLGLPATSGNPADKGFAALAGCRAIPSATISLVTAAQSSSPKALESSGEVSAATASTGSEKQEVLEVRPPPGSGGRVLRLGVLDHVRLRASLVAGLVRSMVETCSVYKATDTCVDICIGVCIDSRMYRGKRGSLTPLMPPHLRPIHIMPPPSSVSPWFQQRLYQRMPTFAQNARLKSP